MNRIKKIISTNIFFLIIITIAVFSLYGKSINYELLSLDDGLSISSSINFISDIKNIHKLFITDCYYNLANDYKGFYYRPILTLSFAIESLLFGLNSKVYHITNIILFILCIYLMYIFLLKLNLNKVVLKSVLLLLVVHPVFVSNIVYVSTRAESFLAIFSILSLININSYFTCNKIKNLFLSLFFFILALFTKESAIVLIFIFPIFLYSLNKFNFRKILYLYILFLIVGIGYFILRSFAVSSIHFISILKSFKFILYKNIINGFIVYINKLLIPNNIPVCLYEYVPDILSVAKTIIFIIFLTIIYYKNFINRKYILLGLSIFFLYLLPTCFILQNQIFFHRLLLPSLGIILILILFVQKIIELYPMTKKYLLFSFIILVLIFSFGSYIQADKYKNDTIFVLNGYNDSPKYHVFVSGIGNLYKEKGNYNKALDYFYLAEKFVPGKYVNNIAQILTFQEKFDEAEKFLKQNIEIENNYINKAISYVILTSIYEQKQDYKTALEYAKKAYQQNPYNIDFSVNLARQYYLNNQYQQALNIYFELLKFNKKESQYYYSIALLYDKLQDKEKAVEYINEAISLDKRNEKYDEFLKKLLNEKQKL